MNRQDRIRIPDRAGRLSGIYLGIRMLDADE